MRRLATTLLAVVGCWGGAAPAAAKAHLTTEEALALAFPGAAIERRTIYLQPEQLERASFLAGQKVESALVVAYVATKDGAISGTAYFDAHLVRTLPETLMVAVDGAGRVLRVEVLTFDEPEDYLPRPAWYEQFVGEDLGPELALKKAIHPVTGASLTARATTDAVRRALALDRVLREAKGP